MSQGLDKLIDRLLAFETQQIRFLPTDIQTSLKTVAQTNSWTLTGLETSRFTAKKLAWLNAKQSKKSGLNFGRYEDLV